MESKWKRNRRRRAKSRERAEQEDLASSRTSAEENIRVTGKPVGGGEMIGRSMREPGHATCQTEKQHSGTGRKQSGVF